jgi:N-acetyl sugar amidotransferase
MASTRPGIVFDLDGVCKPCTVAELRQHIDWYSRWHELVELCNKYRRIDGSYDCIITGSGGKDSHFQVYMMKEQLGMHPLLLNIANYSYTKTGWDNFLNWSETFNCDVVSLFLRRKAAKTFTRIAFEKLGSPTWSWDRNVYSWPIQEALRRNIPLVIYGENISYEYGGAQEESPFAYEQINNEAVRPLNVDEWIEWSNGHLNRHDFVTMLYPDEGVIRDKLQPIYLSYFVPWSGRENANRAKLWGFKTLDHEWVRKGFIEQYDQIDSCSYLFHPLLKYPKYAHARATDVAALWVRQGYITRDWAMKLIKEHDHLLDEKIVEEFAQFCGYTVREVYEVMDRWYNPDLFVRDNYGVWKSKEWLPS